MKCQHLRVTKLVYFINVKMRWQLKKFPHSFVLVFSCYSNNRYETTFEKMLGAICINIFFSKTWFQPKENSPCSATRNFQFDGKICYSLALFSWAWYDSNKKCFIPTVHFIFVVNLIIWACFLKESHKTFLLAY